VKKLGSIPPLVPALVRPTLDTPFHVDYQWWDRRNLNLSAELRAHLCDTHREVFTDEVDTDERIDWVNQRTGEVTQVHGLQHILRVHCSKEPGYIDSGLSLVDAVLRVFLANGNSPMSAKELASVIGRRPEKILQTLSGKRVYKGLRPYVS
jgi:hypothetical protein